MKRSKLGKMLINLIPNKQVRRQKRRQWKNYGIPLHEYATNSSLSMHPFVIWVLEWTDITVKNVFEIGANYCQDAAGLQYMFKLPDCDVYAFEAHPDIVAEARKLYSFNIIHTAVSNNPGTVEFNCVPLDTGDPGTSSMRSCSAYHYEKKVQVQAIRMDDFLKERNIKEIDFLKVDVEGCSYEVLEGFGSRLTDVKIIHVEHEHEPAWDGQKLFEDIENLLKDNDFIMVYFQRYNTQSDSFWVQSRYVRKNNFIQYLNKPDCKKAN